MPYLSGLELIFSFDHPGVGFHWRATIVTVEIGISQSLDLDVDILGQELDQRCYSASGR